jgi:tripartite-type tricarboxylate transporter receptor subunit TctC
MIPRNFLILSEAPKGRSRRTHFIAAAFLLVLALFLPPPAQADDAVASFYQGKDVRLIVGYSPGGLYDITARLVARHLGDHIPGKPTIVVENMPGAGSITTILHLYTTAPRDGSVIGMVARSYPIDPLFNPASRKYDPLRLNPIGATSSEVSVAVTWYTTPIKTFADLLATKATFGATGMLDDTGRFALLAQNLTGAKIALVMGYPGGNDVTNAMEKGEVDGRFGWSWGSIKSRARPWLEGHKINIILQQGLKKAPDLPDTPFILDYAKSDEDRQALDLIFAPQSFAWPFIAPPDLPAERLAALRRAFDATMKDKDFLAEADKLNIEIDPMTGEDMAALITRILAYPPATVARADQLTKQAR